MTDRRPMPGRTAELATTASLTLVLVAVTYAAIAHGGFHGTELAVVLVLVTVALGCALVSTPPERSDVGAATLAAAALAAWYLVAGVVDGHPAGAGPAVGLLLGAAAILTIVKRADLGDREFVLMGVLAVGALVALSGWVGVAFHYGPWAIEDNGLWRAASTVTYANATGGLCGATALVALDRVIVGASRPVSGVIAMTCALGLFATASRGAVAGFVVGLVVLGGLRRRHHLSAMVTPLLGAAVGFGALVPSLQSGHAARPVIAITGVVVGLAISVAPTRIAIGAALVCVALGLGSPTIRREARDAWAPISSQRLTTESSDRAHERTAALQLARNHLATGVGPGQVVLTWHVYYFVPVELSVRYVHNEYLQTLVESGVVGLAIVVVGGTAVLWATARKARRAPTELAAAGILSAFAMLAVHSTTDFLWHVPIVPLVMSCFIGLLSAAPAQDADLPNTDRDVFRI